MNGPDHPAETRGALAAGVIGVPFGWLLLFFALPFLIVVKISLSTAVVAVPPYAPLISLEDGWLPHLHASLDNYRLLADDPTYLAALWGSLRIAAVSTLICLVVGYPMALAIARASPGRRAVLLMLVILPFWTSFLIRVYAWMGILNTNGLINHWLLSWRLIAEPLPLLYSEFAVHLGIVYAYLPFMVLPLYAVLERQDRALVEAAWDLGAGPWRAFVAVTLPLSMPGVVAGCFLVFVPAVGEFVIPELLGGSDTLMIGRVLWTEFFGNRDWPAAAAVAVVLLLVVVGPVLLAQRIGGRAAGRTG